MTQWMNLVWERSAWSPRHQPDYEMVGTPLFNFCFSWLYVGHPSCAINPVLFFCQRLCCASSLTNRFVTPANVKKAITVEPSPNAVLATMADHTVQSVNKWSLWTHTYCTCLCTHAAHTVIIAWVAFVYKHLQTYSDMHKRIAALEACQISFFNSASRSEPKRVRSAECLKKWTWHLLNQIEIKIVKRKPNLRNLLLAFAQRFVLLEGYSVFHRQLSIASHTHAHTIKLICLTTMCSSVQIVTYRHSYYI